MQDESVDVKEELGLAISVESLNIFVDQQIIKHN